ncbi:Tetratricopeptide repeat (TPR) superfamily protein [Trifolium repens]|nr:Tetratricopeptide repeat (TPR) superfamily protein [Trifolium repens]
MQDELNRERVENNEMTEDREIMGIVALPQTTFKDSTPIAINRFSPRSFNSSLSKQSEVWIPKVCVETTRGVEVEVNTKSDWGHVGDAMVVYDQLISNRPNDFSGYLAKASCQRQRY